MIDSEISEEQLRALLKEYIKDNYKTQNEFARATNCSRAYVSAVLYGKSRMPPSWAKLVGYTCRKIILPIKK